MKKIILGLMTFLPALCFAQTMPQPPASWVAFEKEQSIKRSALQKEQNDERTAFLRMHPEVQQYFNEVHSISQARLRTWKASHPNHPEI